MQNQIKQLKSKLELCIELTEELKPIESLASTFQVVIGHNGTHNEWGNLVTKVNSKEIEKAVDSIFLAKCWVDKTLKEFESEEDLDKGSTKFIMDINTWKSYDHYGKIDYIKLQITECVGINANIPVMNNIRILSGGNNTYQHLSEARSWLEAELDRDHESQKGPRLV